MTDETMTNDKIITLSVLTHYDTNLKKWVLTQVTGGEGSEIEEIQTAVAALQEAQELIII